MTNINFFTLGKKCKKQQQKKIDALFVKSFKHQNRN